MADSVAMIDAMKAHLDTLPKMANGDVRVADPTDLAVTFVGIVAPMYGADLDALQVERDAFQNVARQNGDELIGLRAEVDNLRQVVAQVDAQLHAGDLAAARAALGTV